MTFGQTGRPEYDNARMNSQLDRVRRRVGDTPEIQLARQAKAEKAEAERERKQALRREQQAGTDTVIERVVGWIRRRRSSAEGD